MPLPCLLLSIHHIFFEKYRLTNAHFPAIILELPKTAGAARRKSCRGALNKTFLRVFLSSGRKTLFIFGGENYAQR